MNLDRDFADLLNERDITREMIFQAARRYVSDRLDQPSTDDLYSDLTLSGTGADQLTDRLAADGPGLQQIALAVLTAAWEDPAERPRIVRCLDEVSGRLPVTDALTMAVMLVYGLQLLVRTGSSIEETTERRPDGSFVTHRSNHKGVLALLLKNRAAEPQPQLPPGRTPTEAHHTLILYDIQDSSAIKEQPKREVVTRLNQVFREAFGDLGIRYDEVQPRDRGDGYQFAVPEPEGALTEIVTTLPGLVGKHLAAALPDLRVRLGLHTDLLHATPHGWDGDGFMLLDRYTNAKEVKRRLAESDQRLATVMSIGACALTCWRGYGPDDWTPVFVKVNGVRTRVYLRLS